MKTFCFQNLVNLLKISFIAYKFYYKSTIAFQNAKWLGKRVYVTLEAKSWL